MSEIDEGGGWPFDDEEDRGQAKLYRPGAGRQGKPARARRRSSSDTNARIMLGCRIHWLDDNDVEHAGKWISASVNRSQAESAAFRLYDDNAELICRWVVIERLDGLELAVVEADGPDRQIRWKSFKGAPMPDHLKKENRRL